MLRFADSAIFLKGRGALWKTRTEIRVCGLFNYLVRPVNPFCTLIREIEANLFVPAEGCNSQSVLFSSPG